MARPEVSKMTSLRQAIVAGTISMSGIRITLWRGFSGWKCRYLQLRGSQKGSDGGLSEYSEGGKGESLLTMERIRSAYHPDSGPARALAAGPVAGPEPGCFHGQTVKPFRAVTFTGMVHAGGTRAHPGGKQGGVEDSPHF